jgi:hypothetical protein
MRRFKDEQLNSTPFPLVLIEAKADAGINSHLTMESPADRMGARPEKAGIMTATTALKSLVMKEIGTTPNGPVLTTTPEESAKIIKSLLDGGHPAVLSRVGNDHYDIHVVDDDGSVKQFRKKIG